MLLRYSKSDVVRNFSRERYLGNEGRFSRLLFFFLAARFAVPNWKMDNAIALTSKRVSKNKDSARYPTQCIY